MIASDLGTLFVHVPKAAGQSVELALCNGLGVSWRERRQHPELALGKSTDAGYPASLGHLTAREYIDLGVVRDPWDRVMSVYHYLGFDVQHSLSDWVLNHFPEPGHDPNGLMVRPQTDYLCDAEGRVMVDAILRYESLADDWRSVATRLGLDAELPRVNSTRRWGWRPTDMVRFGRRRGYGTMAKYYWYKAPTVRRAYSRAAHARIADMYASDIETFGYAPSA